MAAVVRIGDQCSGHGGFAPASFTAGSGNVFVNGTGVVREGDLRADHSYGSSDHASVVQAGDGSNSVKVNGKGLVRVGDHISLHVSGNSDCSSFAAQGSGNVFAG